MNPIQRSFRIFIRQIAKDSMLIVVCIAPILAGSAFKFAIPAVETFLCSTFDKTSVLSEYYLLFDLFLSILTPYMFCFVSAMVILTEFDENMIRYLAVTPVGIRGYFISRLVIPSMISFFITIILMICFSLTVWSPALLVTVSALSSMIGICVALLVISFSANRVEGMAFSKLSGLLMLGLPIPFFITNDVQYLFSILPSFWIAKLCIEENILHLIPATILTAVMLTVLYRKYKHKIR